MPLYPRDRPRENADSLNERAGGERRGERRDYAHDDRGSPLRSSTGGGAGAGGAGGGTATPTSDRPEPEPPEGGELRMMSVAVSPAFDAITITFSRAVDLASAQADGRFTITEFGGMPPEPALVTLNTIRAVTAPGETVVLHLSRPLVPNRTHTVTVNRLTPDLLAFGTTDVFLSGSRMVSFVSTATPLEITDAGHNAAYTRLTVTFNRVIDGGSVTDASQFRVILPPGDSGPVPPAVPTSVSAPSTGARTATLVFASALPQGAMLTLEVLARAPPAGVRDAYETPTYLAPASTYSFEFTTDEAPAFDVSSVSHTGNRVDIVFTNPVDRSTLSPTAAVAVAETRSRTAVTRHASTPIALSTDGLTVTYTAMDPLARSTQYTVTFDAALRDIFGQSLPSGASETFTTRGEFFVVAGSVVPDMTDDPPNVEFMFNAPVDASTLRADEDSPWRVRVAPSSGGRTVQPSAVTVLDDGVTVRLDFASRLRGGAWRLLVRGEVASTSGDGYNGQSREFSILHEFAMVDGPVARERGGQIHFVMSSGQVTGENGRPSYALGLTQFRVRAGGRDVWLSRPQASRGTDGVWSFQLSASALRAAGNPTTATLDIRSTLEDANGNRFRGGDGHVSNPPWLSWTFPVTPQPQTTTLAIDEVAVHGADLFYIEFEENINLLDATSKAIVIRSSPRPTITVRVQYPDLPGPSSRIYVRLSRAPTRGESIAITVPAGIRSADGTKASVSTPRNILWTVPRRTYTVERIQDTSSRTLLSAIFHFSEAVPAGNHVTSFRVNGGARILSANAGGVTNNDPTTRTAISVVIDPRNLRPGTYSLWVVANGLDSDTGAELAGDAASRTISLTLGAGSGLQPDGSKDVFERANPLITLGYSGTIPATGSVMRDGRRHINARVADASSWTVSARHAASAGGSVQSWRVRVTSVEVIEGTGVRLRVDVPPGWQASWTVTGPTVRDGNRDVALGKALTT